MATRSSVLAWRIPGMGEPGGLPSMRSHRAAAAVKVIPFVLKTQWLFFSLNNTRVKPLCPLPTGHTYIHTPLSCCPSTPRSGPLALAIQLPAVLFISVLTSSPSPPSRPCSAVTPMSPPPAISPTVSTLSNTLLPYSEHSDPYAFHTLFLVLFFSLVVNT